MEGKSIMFVYLKFALIGLIAIPIHATDYAKYEEKPTYLTHETSIPAPSLWPLSRDGFEVAARARPCVCPFGQNLAIHEQTTIKPYNFDDEYTIDTIKIHNLNIHTEIEVFKEKRTKGQPSFYFSKDGQTLRIKHNNQCKNYSIPLKHTHTTDEKFTIAHEQFYNTNVLLQQLALKTYVYKNPGIGSGTLLHFLTDTKRDKDVLSGKASIFYHAQTARLICMNLDETIEVHTLAIN